MRSSRWVVAILLTLLVIAGCATQSALIGKPAPDFRLRDQDDRLIQLSSYQGKQSLVLVFYNTSS